VICLTTKSAEDTRELAGSLANLARPGDVVLLAGDLGAGKTAFAQGFGRALGVTESITSPTFVLVHTYQGRLRLVHADAYRLEHLGEIIDLGLPELLDEGAVALIEWGDRLAPALAPDFLEVRLEMGAGDDQRHLCLRTVGPGWGARLRSLTMAVARWRVTGDEWTSEGQGQPGPRGDDQ